MKLIAVVGLALIGSAYLGRKWLRAERNVSQAWMIDHERRQWGVGIDQVAICWPIRKVVNEAPSFQTAKLRKRA